MNVYPNLENKSICNLFVSSVMKWKNDAKLVHSNQANTVNCYAQLSDFSDFLTNLIHLKK